MDTNNNIPSAPLSLQNNKKGSLSWFQARQEQWTIDSPRRQQPIEPILLVTPPVSSSSNDAASTTTTTPTPSTLEKSSETHHHQQARHNQYTNHQSLNDSSSSSSSSKNNNKRPVVVTTITITSRSTPFTIRDESSQLSIGKPSITPPIGVVTPPPPPARSMKTKETTLVNNTQAGDRIKEPPANTPPPPLTSTAPELPTSFQTAGVCRLHENTGVVVDDDNNTDIIGHTTTNDEEEAVLLLLPASAAAPIVIKQSRTHKFAPKNNSETDVEQQQQQPFTAILQYQVPPPPDKPSTSPPRPPPPLTSLNESVSPPASNPMLLSPVSTLCSPPSPEALKVLPLVVATKKEVEQIATTACPAPPPAPSSTELELFGQDKKELEEGDVENQLQQHQEQRPDPSSNSTLAVVGCMHHHHQQEERRPDPSSNSNLAVVGCRKYQLKHSKEDKISEETPGVSTAVHNNNNNNMESDTSTMIRKINNAYEEVKQADMKQSVRKVSPLSSSSSSTTTTTNTTTELHSGPASTVHASQRHQQACENLRLLERRIETTLQQLLLEGENGPRQHSLLDTTTQKFTLVESSAPSSVSNLTLINDQDSSDAYAVSGRWGLKEWFVHCSQSLSFATQASTLSLFTATDPLPFRIGSSPLLESISMESGILLPKVKGQETDGLLTRTGFVPILAILGLTSGLVSFILVTGQMVDVASLSLILIAPLVYWQNQKLQPLVQLRSRQSQLRDKAQYLYQRNQLLQEALIILETRVKSFGNVQHDLNVTACQSNTQIHNLVLVAHETRDVQTQIKNALVSKVMLDVLSNSFEATGLNKDVTIHTQNVRLPLSRLAMPGIVFHSDRNLASLASCSADALTVSDVCALVRTIQEETVPDHKCILRFEPKSRRRELQPQ